MSPRLERPNSAEGAGAREPAHGGPRLPPAARASRPGALLVFYDGECRLCAAAAAWALARDRAGALEPVPYQAPEARERLGPQRAARAAVELHVWSAETGVRAGVDAVAELLRRLPGWRWAGELVGSRAVAWLARPAYRLVARGRGRFGAARCPLPRRAGAPPPR